MESVVLVIHVIVALAIIVLVLLQRSEGGGLGIGGGGMGNFASARGTANALTRLTAFCAFAFFLTSITLGVIANEKTKEDVGILKGISAQKEQPAKEEKDTGSAYPSIEYDNKDAASTPAPAQLNVEVKGDGDASSATDSTAGAAQEDQGGVQAPERKTTDEGNSASKPGVPATE